MNRWIISTLLIVAIPVELRASPPTQTPAPNVSFQELCSYDQLCRRVRNPDDTPVAPKASVAKLLEMMADPIIEYAQLYGVDPRAVAGAILAENSMNVQIDDEIQNWIVRHGVWGSRALMNRGMTIGPGQINQAPAMAADAHIASLGLRAARSQDEIVQRLLTPAGAAEYAAAIVRKAQDAYKAQGIDISNRPDILVTLYNLGEDRQTFEKRAQENRDAGNIPRPNFMGFFANENLPFIEQTIGWNPRDGRTQRAKTRSLADPGTVARVKDTLRLSARPPTCRANGAGQEGEWNARQTMERAEEFEAASATYAEVIGKTVDCRMREWVMLRTSRGEIGWTPRSDLSSALEFLGELNVHRTMGIDSSVNLPSAALDWQCRGAGGRCHQSAMSAYGEQDYLGSEENGMHYFRLKSFDRLDPIEWRNGGDCSFRTNYADFRKQLLESSKPENSSNSSDAKVWPRAEALAFAADLAAKKESMKRRFNLSEFDSPGNPFASLFSRLEQTIKDCTDGVNECYTMGDESFLQRLVALDLAKTPSLQNLQSLISGLNNRVMILSGPPEDPERRARWMENFEKTEAQKAEVIRAEIERTKTSCQRLADVRSPVAFEAFRVLSDFADGLSNSQLGLINRMEFNQIGRQCDMLYSLEYFRVNQRYPWGDDITACEFPDENPSGMGYYGRSDTVLATMSFRILSRLPNVSEDMAGEIKNLAARLEHFKKQMASYPATQWWQRSNAPSSSNRSRQESVIDQLGRCNYHPLETAKALERLASNECIQTILVGDMRLARGMAVIPKARIVFDPNMAGDRFAFIQKSECQGELRRRPLDGWRPAQ